MINEVQITGTTGSKQREQIMNTSSYYVSSEGELSQRIHRQLLILFIHYLLFLFITNQSWLPCGQMLTGTLKKAQMEAEIIQISLIRSRAFLLFIIDRNAMLPSSSVQSLDTFSSQSKQNFLLFSCSTSLMFGGQHLFNIVSSLQLS